MEAGWDEVRARRLARSSLSLRASRGRLVEVVSAVCGVHAQVQAAAELLNVNISTVVAWCQAGRLDGVSRTHHGPCGAACTPKIIAELRKPVRRR